MRAGVTSTEKKAKVVQGPVLGFEDPNITGIRIKELENVLSESKSYLLFMLEAKCADLVEKSRGFRGDLGGV